MKKFLRIVGILVGIILLAIIGMGAYINFKSLPNYNASNPAPDLTVEVTPERVEAGRALVTLNCAGCHKHDKKQFVGRVFDDVAANDAFGEIIIPNITQHEDYGIGKYTDGELYRLLRTGVKSNGEVMLPIMPRWVIADDEEIYAMIAFLRSDDPTVQAAGEALPSYQSSFLAKALLNFAFKPYPMKEQYPRKPLLKDTIAYGAHLVNNTYGCYYCHSASLEAWDLENPVNTPGYLGGGTVFYFPEGHEVTSLSLLMDGKSDVSNWTAEQFVDAVKYGQRPNKPAYQLPMHPYNLLDTAEIRAIYHYIKDYSESL